jgi:thymidylate synthase
MNHAETQYLNLLREVLEKGHHRKTRNSNTFSLFGKHLEFDLKNGEFPLLTTKKMFFRGIFEELAFFLRGETNSKILEEKGINIWKGNTTREFLDSINLTNYQEGDMGPMYFYQIYHYNHPYEGCNTDYNKLTSGMRENGMNQFAQVIHLLKTDRYSRRILMTTFNPVQACQGVLYPCHGIVIQFAVEGENELCCHMYQRSADLFHGLPFNIASYALLTILLCKYLNDTNDVYENELKNFVPGKLVVSLGDCHIYESHMEAVKTQLVRETHPFPKIVVDDLITDLTKVEFSSLKLVDYICHPNIKVDMVA